MSLEANRSLNGLWHQKMKVERFVRIYIILLQCHLSFFRKASKMRAQLPTKKSLPKHLKSYVRKWYVKAYQYKYTTKNIIIVKKSENKCGCFCPNIINFLWLLCQNEIKSSLDFSMAGRNQVRVQMLDISGNLQAFFTLSW